MKYLRQLAILFALCVAGDLLSVLCAGKLPGNVLGMSLLFILLAFGVIKLSHVEEAADFFLKNMAFFFLPACLGILDVFPQIKSQLVPILAVIILTTLITAAVTAGTVHLVLKLQARRAPVETAVPAETVHSEEATLS
ncbi:CidA/LrgA family protein [Intestinibacillus massiliensis]